MKYPIFWPQFYTATILEWKLLLKQDKYKDTIIESLRFLVNEKRITLYAFVIMSNHMHLIWQPLNEFTPDNIQHSLMSFTAIVVGRRRNNGDQWAYVMPTAAKRLNANKGEVINCGQYSG